jgi:hypothetical protein
MFANRVQFTLLSHGPNDLLVFASHRHWPIKVALTTLRKDEQLARQDVQELIMISNASNRMINMVLNPGQSYLF